MYFGIAVILERDKALSLSPIYPKFETIQKSRIIRLEDAVILRSLSCFRSLSAL